MKPWVEHHAFPTVHQQSLGIKRTCHAKWVLWILNLYKSKHDCSWGFGRVTWLHFGDTLGTKRVSALLSIFIFFVFYSPTWSLCFTDMTCLHDHPQSSTQSLGTWHLDGDVVTFSWQNLGHKVDKIHRGSWCSNHIMIYDDLKWTYLLFDSG